MIIFATDIVYDTMDKVKIKDYKSLRDIALKIGDVNLLIGANGAGKTLTLRTLRKSLK